jgi:hypothetical protein
LDGSRLTGSLPFPVARHLVYPDRNGKAENFTRFYVPFRLKTEP